MRWTDDSMYEGDWVRGIQHGKGKMIFPDGTVKEGYFENNIFVNHPIKRSSSQSKLSSSSLRKKKNSSRLIITDKKNATGGKNNMPNRKYSNSSRDFSTNNQFDSSNPNTGYLNDDNFEQSTPAALIHKQKPKRSASDSNSSFGDGLPSPYMNPEREYMLN